MTPLRIAAAQIAGTENPGEHYIAKNAEAIRAFMHAASKAGARLVQFHEGALSGYPSKTQMSSTGPDNIGESDWSKVAWHTLDKELRSICQLAGELKLWVVLGSVHLRNTSDHIIASILFQITGTSLRAMISGLYLTQKCRTCTRPDKNRLPFV